MDLHGVVEISDDDEPFFEPQSHVDVDLSSTQKSRPRLLDTPPRSSKKRKVNVTEASKVENTQLPQRLVASFPGGKSEGAPSAEQDIVTLPSDDILVCMQCYACIERSQWSEHSDYHIALDFQGKATQPQISGSSQIRSSPKKQGHRNIAGTVHDDRGERAKEDTLQVHAQPNHTRRNAQTTERFNKDQRLTNDTALRTGYSDPEDLLSVSEALNLLQTPERAEDYLIAYRSRYGPLPWDGIVDESTIK